MAGALKILNFSVASKLFGIDKFDDFLFFFGNFSNRFPKFTSCVSSFLKSHPLESKILLAKLVHFKIININQTKIFEAEFRMTGNEVTISRLPQGPTMAFADE